jgi:NAD(P)-dependent dehydrogenase (short-subunit alcohol dehydrogenase family)
LKPGAEQFDSRPLAGRKVLITGATRGIGLAAAEGLARMGASIIVHGRDQNRVDAAVTALAQAAPESSSAGIVADLGSLAAVRKMANEIDARHERLDVLINNAGLARLRREETVDGYERALAVNHLAPFLLTNLLLEKLKSSAPARIVNVSSNAHLRAAFDIDDLNWEQRRYDSWGAYGATKLANILFTRELARRLDGTGITVNCLHPGLVATNIFAGLGVLGALFGFLSKPFMLTAAAGAKTSIHLASADEAATASGQFFRNSRRAEPSAAARSDATARKLWQISAELTGLNG